MVGWHECPTDVKGFVVCFLVISILGKTSTAFLCHWVTRLLLSIYIFGSDNIACSIVQKVKRNFYPVLNSDFQQLIAQLNCFTFLMFKDKNYYIWVLRSVYLFVKKSWRIIANYGILTTFFLRSSTFKWKPTLWYVFLGCLVFNAVSR